MKNSIFEWLPHSSPQQPQDLRPYHLVSLSSSGDNDALCFKPTEEENCKFWRGELSESRTAGSSWWWGSFQREGVRLRTSLEVNTSLEVFTNWVAKMEVRGIPIQSLHKEMENSWSLTSLTRLRWFIREPHLNVKEVITYLHSERYRFVKAIFLYLINLNKL